MIRQALLQEVNWLLRSCSRRKLNNNAKNIAKLTTSMPCPVFANRTCLKDPEAVHPVDAPHSSPPLDPP